MSVKADQVILALVALWGAAPAFEGVQVADGPQSNSDASSDWLFVGSDGDAPLDGMQAVAGDQDWMAFQRVKKETAGVTCALVVVGGDGDTVAVRARAFSLLGSAEDLVRADPSLTGLVMTAGLSSYQYYPAITTKGPKARLVFTITYQAQL